MEIKLKVKIRKNQNKRGNIFFDKIKVTIKTKNIKNKTENKFNRPLDKIIVNISFYFY